MAVWNWRSTSSVAEVLIENVAEKFLSVWRDRVLACRVFFDEPQNLRCSSARPRGRAAFCIWISASPLLAAFGGHLHVALVAASCEGPSITPRRQRWAADRLHPSSELVGKLVEIVAPRRDRSTAPEIRRFHPDERAETSGDLFSRAAPVGRRTAGLSWRAACSCLRCAQRLRKMRST